MQQETCINFKMTNSIPVKGNCNNLYTKHIIYSNPDVTKGDI